MRPLAGSFSTRLVGVRFAPRYPDVVFELEHRLRFHEARTGGPARPVKVLLRRHPDNPVDVHAIAVEAVGLGHLGHLPAGLAFRLAQEIDQGVEWRAEVVNVVIHPAEPLQPGVEVHLERAS